MSKSLTDLTVREFAKTLASEAPAPGGGSSSALSGALGAGLVSMVCRLTVGKEKYAEHQALVKDVMVKADVLREKLLDAVQSDTDAFDAVMKAFGMPKDTDEQKAARTAAIQAGYKIAVASPEEMAKDCLAVVQLAEACLAKTNVNAASDLAVGALQAYAGLKGALANVRINLPPIKDTAYVEQKKAWAADMQKEAARIREIVEREVAKEVG